MSPVLLVLSHLRWQGADARHPQLFTRLARRWQVFYVEAPQPGAWTPRLDIRELGPRLTLLTPHLPGAASAGAGFAYAPPTDLAALRALLQRCLDARGGVPDVAWLSTPLALPLAQAFGAVPVVYDCAAALGACDGAPALLHRLEAELMRQAALLLTAGPSQQQLHAPRHPQVHCLPDAVDLLHFASRRSQAGGARALQGHLPRPRLGYAGVIDARIDLALVARLADALPAAAVVMAGPVVCLPPQRLPRRPNLHWLGAQPAPLLPDLLAGWDLALLPFVRDGTTRFLLPPQALEFMAAGLPVVSTALPDVQALYFPAVTIASAEHFAEACTALLAEGTLARCARLAEMQRHVAARSWDDVAATVQRLLAATCARGARTPRDAAQDRMAAPA